MRKISLFVFMGALTAVAQNPWQGTPGLIMSGSASSGSSGIEIQFAVVAKPPRGDLAGMVDISGVKTSDSDVIYRYVVDKKHKRYFGYNISAQATSVAGQYRVNIAPLTMELADFGEPIQASFEGTFTPVLLPKYPEPQMVTEDDTIELVLLESPDGKEKIVDYLRVDKILEPPTADTDAEPRDYTPDDGPVTFNFENATFWVDGQKFSGSFGSDIRPGATLLACIPGQGRYFLSLVPRQGFRQSGVIRDNVILFSGGGHRFELRTTSLIVGAKGAWNLYVVHSASYLPEDREDVQFYVDRYENLIRK